jgi:hypothetical protein
MKYLLLFVILGFSLSACLTVEETYTFNSDGSGKAVFQIRLTDMEAVLNQAKWDGSEENLKQLSFESLALQLRTLEGLNEVSILDNLQQHTWGVAFSFDHVLALNQALNVILIDKPHDNWHTFFVHSKQGIARSHQMDKLRIGEILRNDPQFSTILEQTLQSMHYRMSYDFASPVKVVYSDQGLILDAKRPNHLELEANFLDLRRTPRLLDVSVVLK